MRLTLFSNSVITGDFKMKEQPRLKILYILLALLLIFIWGNSMLSREQSVAQSSAFSALIEPVLDFLKSKGIPVTQHLVRKFAHFAEFAALGAVLGLILNAKDHRRPFNFSYVIFCGITVAVIDEAIQLFSEGRGSRVQDVLLDTSGMITGLVVVTLVVFLIRRVH